MKIPEKIKLRPHHFGWLAITQGINSRVAEQIKDPEVYNLLGRENVQKFRDIPVEMTMGADFICGGCKKYDPIKGVCAEYYEKEKGETKSPEQLREEADIYGLKNVEENLQKLKTIGDILDWRPKEECDW